MNKRRSTFLILGTLILLSLGLSSCVSVKAYEKMYLNDHDMALKARKGDFYERNFEAYREGAAGANGGKVGGGCGCNWIGYEMDIHSAVWIDVARGIRPEPARQP